LIRLLRALVDSAALRHNLGTIRAYAPGAKVMAVVKANAYGHGLVSTALALADADSFAVARLEEGLALRAAGVRAPIVLLEGVFSAEQLAEAAQHEAVLRCLG
jgi:alanine racemase